MKKKEYVIFPPEFLDVLQVLEQASKSGKYKPNGWLKGIKFKKINNINSMYRHLMAYNYGEVRDKDSGLHPLLHVACRALMQYTLDKRNNPYISDDNRIKSSTDCVLTVQGCVNPNWNVTPLIDSKDCIYDQNEEVI